MDTKGVIDMGMQKKHERPDAMPLMADWQGSGDKGAFWMAAFCGLVQGSSTFKLSRARHRLRGGRFAFVHVDIGWTGATVAHLQLSGRGPTPL